MSVSQKCQYGLRALFELNKRDRSKPTTIAQIAKAQSIPAKFLELILGELRQGGFVESRRGVHGGYLLASEPGKLTVGEVIRFIDGPIAPVRGLNRAKSENGTPRANNVFMGMWERAREALANVYDNTTFQDLMDAEEANADYVARYSI